MPNSQDSSTAPDPFDRLFRSLSGDSVLGIEPGLFVPQTAQPYFDGTTVPILGVPLVAGAGSLAVPFGSQPSPDDYMGVYLTLREYAPGLEVLGAVVDRVLEQFGRGLIGAIGRDEMINQLCGLGVAMMHPEMIANLTAGLELSITPESRDRLRAALSTTPPHQLLARQPVLVALSRAFTDDGEAPKADIGPSRLDVAAVMVSHAIGASLKWSEPTPHQPKIGGFPEHIAADLVCNNTLYDSDDLVSVLDRTVRLWRDFGNIGAIKLDGRHPAKLLENITGLEVEDFLSLGFALYVHRLEWTPGSPGRLADTFRSGMEEEKKAAFLSYVARTPEEMTERLRSTPPRSDWDLMAFVESPVLHYPSSDDTPGSLLLIDLAFLVEKITLGLYWLVHDHLRDKEGDLARTRWTQAWADMVEAMVEDDLRPHSPTLLGGGRTYYTEEDLRVAYPDHKTSDVVIDGGDVLLAIEIGSGRPSSEMIRAGNPDALRKDLERLAYKKIRQLDDTAKCLVEKPEKLLGVAASVRPVQPVLVAAGGFVVSPITGNAIAEYCAEGGYLDHAQIRPLAVVTVGEVEMLEGLVESRSISLGKVIGDWKSSTLRAVSLRNYLLARFGSEVMIYRPSRMRPRFDRFAEDVIARLRLRDDPSGNGEAAGAD